MYNSDIEDGDRLAQEIEVTPEMIEAGMDRLRDFRIGQRLEEIVEAVYLAMEIERAS